MEISNSRDGPGKSKRGQGGFGRRASTPDQPLTSESAYLYATASDGDSTTALQTGLMDLSGADWHVVDGIRFRLLVRREPDGGRLSKFIQRLLLDRDTKGPPLGGDHGLTGVREPRPVLPGKGDATAAVAIPDGRELLHA